MPIEFDSITEENFLEWYEKLAEIHELDSDPDKVPYDFRSLWLDTLSGDIPEKSVMDGEFPCKHTLKNNPDCPEE